VRWWTIGRGSKDSKDEMEKGEEIFEMSASLERMYFLSFWVVLSHSLMTDFRCSYGIYPRLVQLGLGVSHLLPLSSLPH